MGLPESVDWAKEVRWVAASLPNNVKPDDSMPSCPSRAAFGMWQRYRQDHDAAAHFWAQVYPKVQRTASKHIGGEDLAAQVDLIEAVEAAAREDEAFLDGRTA